MRRFDEGDAAHPAAASRITPSVSICATPLVTGICHIVRCAQGHSDSKTRSAVDTCRVRMDARQDTWFAEGA